MATHNINNHHFKDYDALNWAKEWVRDELGNKTSAELEHKINLDTEVWFKPDKVKEAVSRPRFEALVTEALATPQSDSQAWSTWIGKQGAILEPMSRVDFEAWVDHLRSKDIIFCSNPGGGHHKSEAEPGKSESVDFTIEKAEILDSPDNVFQVHNGKNKVWCLTEIDNINIDFKGRTPTTKDVSGNVTASTTAMGTELSVKFNSAFEERDALEKLVRDRVERMLHKILEDAIARWGYIVNENVNKGKKPTLGGSSTPDVKKPVQRAPKAADTSKPQSAGRTLVNTTTLTETVAIMTDAEHLFRTFTDADELSRIAHGSCKIVGAMPRAKFEMLDGAIVGEFLEAEKPKRIVQSWRLKDWPDGHFSRLQLEFEEGGNQTNMRVEWRDVPTDKADMTMQNWKRFFVEPIQRVYGRLLI